MLEKTFKQIKTVFTIIISVSILSFIIDALYTTKYTIPAEGYDGLERWAIIITLFGIFASLKFLHPRLGEAEKQNAEEAVKTYAKKYYIRLLTLACVYLFNILSLHFTGVKNFIFLAFITIFALFLCTPSKEQLENETQEDEN